MIARLKQVSFISRERWDLGGVREVFCIRDQGVGEARKGEGELSGLRLGLGWRGGGG